MASQARWTWVWVNSGRWWWTGRPGMMQFMGLQRVGHNWATELNWTELKETNTTIFYFIGSLWLPDTVQSPPFCGSIALYLSSYLPTPILLFAYLSFSWDCGDDVLFFFISLVHAQYTAHTRCPRPLCWMMAPLVSIRIQFVNANRAKETKTKKPKGISYNMKRLPTGKQNISLVVIY